MIKAWKSLRWAIRYRIWRLFLFQPHHLTLVKLQYFSLQTEQKTRREVFYYKKKTNKIWRFSDFWCSGDHRDRHNKVVEHLQWSCPPKGGERVLGSTDCITRKFLGLILLWTLQLFVFYSRNIFFCRIFFFSGISFNAVFLYIWLFFLLFNVSSPSLNKKVIGNLFTVLPFAPLIRWFCKTGNLGCTQGDLLGFDFVLVFDWPLSIVYPWTT